MIRIPERGAADTDPWAALLDFSERVPDGWTLVGGQMVYAHGCERGRTPPFLSVDVDMVVDLRARPDHLEPVARALLAMGFALGDPGPDGYGQRFSRGALAFDVLIPDGLGARRPRTILGSVKAVSISGGSAALARSGRVEVLHAGRRGAIHRPDLVGALLIKSRAAVVDRKAGPERHLRDLAFLYGLVSDPAAVRAALSAKHLQMLRTPDVLPDEDAQVVRGLITATA